MADASDGELTEKEAAKKAATRERWTRYWANKARCEAGEHSGDCPMKTCPERRKTATREQLAAEATARRDAALAEGRRVSAFTPGDPRITGVPGNTLAMTAGGYSSPRVVTPRAQQNLADFLADLSTPGYLHDPQYARALWAWAYAEVQVDILRTEIDKIGMEEAGVDLETEDEVITQEDKWKRRRKNRKERRESMETRLERIEARAAKYRRELGLTPSSQARLSSDVTQAGKNKADLALALAELDRQRQAEQRSAEERQPGQRPLRAIPPAGGAPA